MSPKIPSKKDISIWKRNAKSLAKEKCISHSDALDLLAKSKGFKTWRHLSNQHNQEPKESIDDVLEYTGLTPQAYKNIKEGKVLARESFITVDTNDVKRAKRVILSELKDIMRRSKAHIQIDVLCHIPESLSKIWGENQVSFFNSLVDRFARLNSIKVSSRPDDQIGFPLTFLLSATDPQAGGSKPASGKEV